ncbi:MAG: GIY-YIG nuclease superfamily protein [Parcubacteria group bacterium GW2011_GWB1_43_8b]|nr:MAG: GIY-YIG nuclease superfamily protein [Parcubacteria group bacterium GW2011_GWB1_43_8b]
MNHVKEFNFQYVYVIASIKSGKWYIGCTNNLRKRFQEHNDGKSRYTMGRGPFKLIYFEGCINKLDGYTREKYLKSGMGRKYLKNRLKCFLSLM